MNCSHIALDPAPSNRRDEILVLAAQCIARQGFHGVSMRDLARANGCSVATLYNHFTSKDDLLLAIGQRLFSVIIDDLEAAASAPTDGLTRLEDMLGVTVKDCFTYRDEFLSFTHDKRHIRVTPELAPLVTARDTCVAIWRRVITDGMCDGSVRTDLDADATIWILVSVITGIVDGDRAAEFAGTDIGSFAPSLIAVLIDGLRPRG